MRSRCSSLLAAGWISLLAGCSSEVFMIDGTSSGGTGGAGGGGTTSTSTAVTTSSSSSSSSTTSSSSSSTTSSSSSSTTSSSGTSECSAPADAVHYVDHALGTDDPQHGGGTGACAYRTLTYALSHAAGQVSLADGVYQGDVEGETLPFLLTGKQSLICDDSGTKAILRNAPANGTYDGIVQLAGSANTVSGCFIDGNAMGGYCVVMGASAASKASPHTLTNSVVNDCDNVALHVAAGASNILIANNEFKLGNNSIAWEGESTSASIVDNLFTANGSLDVYCMTPALGITGSGNKRGGGPIQCVGCANCAF